jgi:peptidoglycan/LPS O-acetylase OafA/YrhL
MTIPRPVQTGESRSRVEILDLLRMFAVLAVVLFHYGFRGAAADGYTATSLPDLQWFAKYGDFGVQLFFVLSGFVIAYSAEGRTAINFAIARSARIYPAFFLCMTLTFIATIVIGAPRFETTFLHWFANLFIVAPALKQSFMDGAYWSIVYEITFYGWVALFLATGQFRKHIELIVVCWMAISMLNEAVLHSGILLRLFLTNQSGFFAAGLLLYEMYTGRRTLLVKILLVLAAVTSINQAIGNAQWVREHYQVAIDDRVIAVLCLASIGAVALALRVRRVPLPAPLVLAIGGMTYPMYLLHQHIGYMVLNRLQGIASPALLVVGTTAAVAALSWLIWRHVERPSQKRMKAALNYGVERVAPLAGRMRTRILGARAA